MSKLNLFKAAIFTPLARGRWGLPLLAWSTPGAAKSDLLREICESFDLPFISLSPGEMGEGAFGVVPVPDKSGVIKYPPPDWTLTVATGGVILIDEISCVPPALQPALLGLVLDARIGGTVLHPRVRRIAAANPPEYAANGYDINAAQANRMGHIDWTAPTVQEHTAYMMRGTTGHGGAAERQFSATAEEERVLTAWDGGAWARAVGLETSFLAARPDLKNKCPKVSDPAASRAWPSDRSWTMATRALASADVHGLSPADTDEFVGAFIGHETYAEWATYIREADLPNTADLLDGRVEFKHSADRLDRTVAVLNACCALVAPAEAPRRDERATALWGLLFKLFTTPGTSQDLVLDACLALVRAKVAHNATSAKVRTAYQQLGQHPKFIPLMKAAGFS